MAKIKKLLLEKNFLENIFVAAYFYVLFSLIVFICVLIDKKGVLGFGLDILVPRLL